MIRGEWEANGNDQRKSLVVLINALINVWSLVW